MTFRSCFHQATGTDPLRSGPENNSLGPALGAMEKVQTVARPNPHMYVSAKSTAARVVISKFFAPGTSFMEDNFSKDWKLGENFQVVLVVKNPPANAGDIRDTGSIPESEDLLEMEIYNPLQYSYLENPMNRGAWLCMGLQRVGHN